MKKQAIIAAIVFLALATALIHWQQRPPRTDAMALSGKNIHQTLVYYNQLHFYDDVSNGFVKNANLYQACLVGVKESTHIREVEQAPQGHRLLFANDLYNVSYEALYDSETSTLYLPAESLRNLRVNSSFLAVKLAPKYAEQMTSLLK